MSGHLAVLRDPSGQLTIEDVSHTPYAGLFQPLPGGLMEGFTSDAVWVRFSLLRSPDAPAQWLLQGKPSYRGEAVLYTPDGRGGFTPNRLGEHNPPEERRNPGGHLVFPVEIGDPSADFFIRFQSQGANALQLGLWQTPGYAREHQRGELRTAFKCGALGVVMLMNLIFWLWLRDGIYLNYALLLAGAALQMLLRTGHGEEWFGPMSPEWAATAPVALFAYFCVVATEFVSRLFEFRRHWIWAARVFRAVFVFNGVALVLALFGDVPNLLHWLNLGSLFSTLFGTCFVAYLLLVRRQHQYWLPAAALALGTLNGYITMLYRQGVLDPGTGDLVTLLQNWGSLAPLLLLNIAVANRSRKAERALNLERKSALRASQQAEQALESKVAQRTAELAEANHSLLNALTAKKQAMAQQREFVAMVSHEFRTPLAMIDSTARSLEISAVGDRPEVKPRTTHIRQAVSRLILMIENFLATDKLDTQHPSLRQEVFDVQALLYDLRSAIGEHDGARLRIQTQGHPPAVYADRALIEVALQNLVHNALKYSSGTTPVTLQLSHSAGRAHIDVCDMGNGIPHSEHPHLFEKYYRGPGLESLPGSGLGLYLSRKITRQYGGDVFLLATSTQGSVFRLVLPAAEPAPPVPPHSARPIPTLLTP